ncbi:hypothetical protein FF011L_26710 [Roseimaritima multifibrata]|uniref:Uncharacterized protein n=1 Tax=Roseimaritima multifibrata TaxID=1930274 RepID=A0A517MG83_9BACT|nr:hypothetical protein FF011L_26710 [Roseimaritima multifibrata]
MVAVQESPFLEAGFCKFEHHREACTPSAVPLGFAMTHAGCRNRGFEWVSRSQVAPMLGCEILEHQQNVAVFSQALASGSGLGSEFFNRDFKCSVGVLVRFGLPDLKQAPFALALNALGHLLENIGRFVELKRPCRVVGFATA